MSRASNLQKSTENWEDETKRWEEAIKHLEKFWTEDDNGLATNIQPDVLKTLASTGDRFRSPPIITISIIVV